MENFFYKCEVCGYVHLVPAYWMDFCADLEVEFAHINIKTGEQCSNDRLLLLENEC